MITNIIFSCALVALWALICTGFTEINTPQMTTKMYTYIYNPLGLIAFNGGFLAAFIKIWN